MFNHGKHWVLSAAAKGHFLMQSPSKHRYFEMTQLLFKWMRGLKDLLKLTLSHCGFLWPTSLAYGCVRALYHLPQSSVSAHKHNRNHCHVRRRVVWDVLVTATRYSLLWGKTMACGHEWKWTANRFREIGTGHYLTAILPSHQLPATPVNERCWDPTLLWWSNVI